MIFFFATGTPYIAQAGLKFGIFLPQVPKHWDYMCHSLCLAFKYFLVHSRQHIATRKPPFLYSSGFRILCSGPLTCSNIKLDFPS